MVLAFLFGGIMSIKYWKTPDLTEWLLLLSLGVFGYIGQIYMTKSLQSSETNVVVPLKYLEVVFMIIIGAFWFDEIYTLWTLLGVFLIMFGLLYNIYLKRKRD
jgi:drug/metabolite transporter (DMT)-like permease